MNQTTGSTETNMDDAPLRDDTRNGSTDQDSISLVASLLDYGIKLQNEKAVLVYENNKLKTKNLFKIFLFGKKCDIVKKKNIDR